MSESLAIEKLYMQLRLKGYFRLDFFTSENYQMIKALYKTWLERGYIEKEDEVLKLSYLGYLMFDSLMDDIFRDIKLA